MRNKLFRGTPASPGICIARVVPYIAVMPERLVKTENRKQKTEDKTLYEIERFKNAIEMTEQELISIRKGFLSRTDNHHASMLDIQLLALRDKTIMDGTIELIKKEKRTADSAFRKVVKKTLSNIPRIIDDYIRQRLDDIKDVSRRIMRNLKEQKIESIVAMEKNDHIVIAHDITPSESAQFANRKVVGFATNLGSENSHTSIMARALEIPAVVGLRNIWKSVKSGELAIIDGNNGVVIIDPDESTLRAYRRKEKEIEKHQRNLESMAKLPCVTLDGNAIELAANIEMPFEIKTAIAHGAKGIGLMRTEFLYLKEDRFPSENEQYEVYRDIAEVIAPESLIIRTLDIGGDKLLHTDEMVDANPFLGWRGIRFSLSEKGIFKEQLRAILRANVRKNIKILFPMITDVKEVISAKKILKRVKEELETEGISDDFNIEVGVMIEVPSASLSAKAIAKEVDFLSIGSNDLTQYVLACDRTNRRLADLYNSLHPTILKLISETVDAGHKEHKWVGLCGELAHNPLTIPILIGFGIDELSVSPLYLTKVKKIIRNISMEEAQWLAREILVCNTLTEVEKFLEKKVLTEFSVIREMVERSAL